ncbi:hypothetical protein ACQPZQ_42900 [Pseudonocardia sp. CA-142604]|uniref:hypothetical protein n=1 Tax=Pseudonocardia sp. CA-142604 TaxID=3240024 RepID=UPI003D9433C3
MNERRRAAAQKILGAAVVTAIVLGSVTGLSMATSESWLPPPAAPAAASLRPVPAIGPGDLDDPRLTAALSSCFTDLDSEYANAPNFKVWVEALHRNSERVARSLLMELRVFAAKNDKLAYRALDCTLRTVDTWRRPQRPARPECAAGEQRSGIDLSGARGGGCRPDRTARAEEPDRSARTPRPPERTELPDSRPAKPERAKPVRPPEPPMPAPSKPERPSLAPSKPDRPPTTAPSKPAPSTSESSPPERSTPEQSTPERPTSPPSNPGSSTPEQTESDESE